MPELTPQERLQPALLDRLTDEEPTKTQEPPERRVMSKSRLRQAVLRDLAWLFNATKPTSRRRARSDSARPTIRAELRSAGAVRTAGVLARRHRARAGDPSGDPRFRAANSARRRSKSGPSRWKARSIITTSSASRSAAELWAQPVPLELLVRTEIDLETGKVEIADLAHASGLMDPRLIRHYNLELQHLREMGAEFAQQFPKVAARLGMSGLEVADPYVERLLEGFAFLAARVQLKLDAEFPRFTQTLLEIVYPHYLAPTPSMAVVQLKPDAEDPGLATGVARRPARHDDAERATAADERTVVRIPDRAGRAPLADRARVGDAISRLRPICRSTRCRLPSASKAVSAYG